MKIALTLKVNNLNVKYVYELFTKRTTEAFTLEWLKC